MSVFPHIKLREIVKSEDGQAVVEAAIALPIILTLLCGIIDFGWIYSNQYQTEYAAQAAMRYAVINVASLSNSELTSGARTRAVENITMSDGAINVQLTKSTNSISVTVTRPVKCLTYVASTLFGENYTSKATSVGCY